MGKGRAASDRMEGINVRRRGEVRAGEAVTGVRRLPEQQMRGRGIEKEEGVKRK